MTLGVSMALDRKADDAAVVEACLTGDQDQFRLIFERYRSQAFRLAVGLVGNRDDALDVCQEAFLKAFRGLRRFDRRRPFAPWFYRIVRNVSMDLLRRRKTSEIAQIEPNQNHQVAAPARETPEQRFENSELAERLSRALDRLSPEHREVFRLREIHHLTYDQIAEVVGIPRGTVMSRLFHARRRLRQQLEALL